MRRSLLHPAINNNNTRTHTYPILSRCVCTLHLLSHPLPPYNVRVSNNGVLKCSPCETFFSCPAVCLCLSVHQVLVPSPPFPLSLSIILHRMHCRGFLPFYLQCIGLLGAIIRHSSPIIMWLSETQQTPAYLCTYILHSI